MTRAWKRARLIVEVVFLALGGCNDKGDSAPLVAVVDAAPVAVADAPVPIDAAPVAVADAPVPIDAAPVVVADAPVPIDAAPVVVADAPVPIDAAPVVVADAPVPIDAAPVVVDAPPVVVDAGDQASSAVLTWHSDNYRTGAVLAEKTLTPQAVRDRGLRVRVERPVDGPINAQVLYVPGLDVAGKKKNVLFVESLNNTVFAYDADDATATGTNAGLIWKRHLDDPGDPAARPLPRGIYSTPVIDLAASEMYVVFSTTDTQVDPPGEADFNAAFWLTALDLRTGKVKRAVQASARLQRDDGTMLDFLARNHRQRPALLLAKGSLYLGFGTRSKEELVDYHGWVLRYDAKTFAPQGAWCATVNKLGPSIDTAGEGAGIWMSGSGLAGDDDGNVYLITGNARADETVKSYGNGIIRLRPDGDQLAFAGWFTPDDPDRLLEINDVDLGSGGALVVPGTQLVVGGGKTGVLYSLDRATMALRQAFVAFIDEYDPTFDVLSNWEGGPHLHETPLFWRGSDPEWAYVYDWSEQDYLKAYKLSMTTKQFDTKPIVGSVLALEGIMPGGMMSLSANGNQPGTAIVWALLPASKTEDTYFGAYPARFMAFDGETLELLWETTADTIPKWMPPTIADGRVLVPTTSNKVVIYELDQ